MSKKQTIVIGSDHAGFELKEFIKNLLIVMDYSVEDVGPSDTKSVDYPDYAEKVCARIVKNPLKKGILTCGSGIGMSIAANKIAGIRAALVHDIKSAKLSRQHNNANALVLGARPFNKTKVKQIIKAWLNTGFDGGRHLRRIRKISRLDTKYNKIR